MSVGPEFLPVHRLDLMATVAAIVLLGGCAGPSEPTRPMEDPTASAPAPEATIPLPRDGDTATYTTESYRNLFELRARWEGSPALGPVAYPMLKRAYAPLDAPPPWPPYREAIDPDSNRLVWSVDPCPFNLDADCHGGLDRGYENWRSEVAGLPWGYGSSIFQGRTLQQGLVFVETFPLGFVTITARFEVTAARTVDNHTEFDVTGTLPFDGNATEMIVGHWTLSSESPFALAYRTNLTLASTRTSTFSFGVNATLDEWTRSTGPILVDEHPTWSTAEVDASRALPLERGLPVGAGTDLGLEGYTFRGAWEHLLDADPAIALAMDSSDFRLWNMQVPREDTSSGVLVLREHYVEGSFSYFDGERFESEFVSHDCSWVDVLELELSCEYSGTGPTDGLRGMRGNVSFNDAIPLGTAYQIANASLPRPTRVFVFGTYTNGVEAPAARQEAYYFSFFFPLLDENGDVTADAPFGHVRIDALTGEIRSRTLENV
jgi:hypothetical protein